MAQYYPDQTVIMPMTTIRRERLLPDDAVGEVLVREGERVSAVTPVVSGVRAQRYVILDLARLLGVDDPEELESLVHVGVPEFVKRGDVIAGDRKKKRGLVRCPVDGYVSQFMNGRLILRTGLEEVTVRAGFDALVASVRGNRGVLLETSGALVQGVWGNGRSHFGVLQMEPEGGLAGLEVDEFSTEWRGAIVLVAGQLTGVAIKKAVAQGIGGIVAPGMSADLREIALARKIPIMLTDGFGAEHMSSTVYNVLAENAGRQVALNAHRPQRWAKDRPEVIVPLARDSLPPAPQRDTPLRVGAAVRITRQPFMGVVARVTGLPGTPRVIDNGLRLPVAEVTLPSGRKALVPLANLELFGQG